MAKARIKRKIFNACDIVIIQSGNRISSYSGGIGNLWCPAMVRYGQSMIELNGRWWTVDPHDWETEPDGYFDDVRHKMEIGTASKSSKY